MTPELCRAARALLDWSAETLAAEAGVGVSTVRDYERGARTPIPNNLAAIQRALEKGGVEILTDGVRLRGPKRRG